MINVFKNSWKILFKKPRLMIPDLIFFMISFILGYLFLKSSGILEILKPLLIGETISNETIKTFLTDNSVKLIISFSTFILTTFFFGASLVSFKYYLFKKITENAKISLIKDFRKSQDYLWKVIGIRIIEFVIIVAGSIILGVLLTLINYFINSGFGSLIMSVLVLTLSIILALIFKLALLFRYPVLFYTNTTSWGAIKGSFLIFKKKNKRVFLVFLLLLGINLSLAILGLVGNSFINLTKDLVILSTIIFVIITGLKVILSIVQSTWNDLFVFLIYKSKK